MMNLPSRPPSPSRVPSPSAVGRARAARRRLDGDFETPRHATPLDRSLRFLRENGLLLIGIVFSVAHLAGLFSIEVPVSGWLFAIPLGAAALASVVWRWRRLSSGRNVAVRHDVALGLVLNDTAYALVQMTGERASPLMPLVFLLAASFAVAALPRSAALGLVAITVLQNVVRYACIDVLRTDWHSLVVQAGFTLLFALLYHLVLAARLWASRQSETEAVERRLREAEESARSLRLMVADRSQDQRTVEDETALARRMVLGAVLEVERSVASVLDGAVLALECHAVALFRLSEDEVTLTLRDGRCAAGLLERSPLGAGDGLFGTVMRHGKPVREAGRVAGVNWYQRGVQVRAVCAVPLIERAVDGTGYVRGVVVCDRLEPAPFDEREERFLSELAAQLSRAVEGERLVTELHRSKDAQDRLQRAAEALNKASTLEEVARTTARLAGQLLPGLSLSALTLREGEASAVSHHVLAAEGPRAGEVDGLIYDDNDGVVANVVRMGAPLPARTPGLLEIVKLFDERVTGFGSLRVVPLPGAATLGTIVVGAAGRNAFDHEACRRLDALATLAAGALGRALALAQVSALATQDGLTGLFNRRHTDDLSRRAFLEARRYERPLAVIVTDVDHFKKVNDTHGHAAGDEVLKAIARTLQQAARETDIVGRYGGEEFVIVCPNTDATGARELAERVRRTIERTPIETSAGPLQVTLSLGVCGFPLHGDTLESLVASGDEALYEAKRAGRNRVVLAGLDKETALRKA